MALIGAWQAQGVTVVGVEPFDTDVSSMRAYQSAGIATVDSIDRALGKIALPFALLGEKGNYGMKPTADRVLAHVAGAVGTVGDAKHVTVARSDSDVCAVSRLCERSARPC